MADLNKIVRTTQEAFDKVAAGTHETHTYDDNNMYQVELADPLVVGSSGSGLSIDLETNELKTDIRQIQFNGVTQTPVNGSINIPYGSYSAPGLVKLYAQFGIGVGGNGIINIIKATDSEIETKTETYKPIVPNNLNKAIMEGLGNNSLTWTDQYKSNARATIGANAVSVSATGTATEEIKYITIEGTEKKIAGGGAAVTFVDWS